MPQPENIVIVGAGQAGFWTLKTLRQYDYTGAITLIGDEPHLPYDRPPLSKSVLLGEAEPASTHYVSEADFAQFDVTFLRGERVSAIEREAGAVTTASGKHIPYDHLVIATGTRARRLSLPGAEAAPVFYLRGIEDCLALRGELTEKRRVAVIGGGFIGLEVAAAAAKSGCEVCVIEVAERVMARIVGPQVSRFFEDLHRQNGVSVMTGAIPERLEATSAGTKIHLKDGSAIEADIIVAGIGSVPNEDIAAAAGMKTGNGIWVDEFARTEDPNISAVGDVTCHFNPRLDRRLRLEIWQNAQNQAQACARAICGVGKPYGDIPWGWTDQFGVNLQMLGLPESYADAVVRGKPESGSFSAFYMAGKRVIGVNTVNAVRDMAVARRIMGQDMEVDPQRLGDESVPLKELLRG